MKSTRVTRVDVDGPDRALLRRVNLSRQGTQRRHPRRSLSVSTTTTTTTSSAPPEHAAYYTT